MRHPSRLPLHTLGLSFLALSSSGFALAQAEVSVTVEESPAEAPPSAPPDSSPGQQNAPVSSDQPTTPSQSPTSSPNPAQTDPTAPSSGEATTVSGEESTAAALSPDADAPEAEVTVLGSRLSHTPGSVQVISERKLERFEYDDAGAILVQAPGVYLRTEDGIGLRPNIGMRGVNPDRSKKLTLMEDGVLFGPAPYSAPAAYFFPLMTRMTSVRIIKGPGSVAYGPQTVGGAIDFTSRPIPTLTEGKIDIAAGDFGYAKAHIHFGTSTEQTGFLIEGIHLHDGGFKDLPSGADTGSSRNEWVIKAAHILDPSAAVQQEFGVKLSYNDEVSNETYLGLTDEDLRADPNRRYAASALDQMKNHRTGVMVSHTLTDPARKLELLTQLYRNDYARTWKKINAMRGGNLSDILADPTNPEYAPLYDVLTGAADTSTASETLLIGPNERTFVSEGVQTRARISSTTGPFRHAFEAGARLHYDSIRRRHSQTGYAMLGGELYPDGTPEQVTAANLDETHALALHVLDSISWKNLTLSPGIRGEFLKSQSHDQLAGTDTSRYVAAFLPGVGAYYGAADWVGLLAGVHKGFSPPAPGSDSSVAPESSVNYEGGARFFQGPGRLELIGFYNDYSNLTDICTLASGCIDSNLDRQFSAGKAKIYGFEAMLEHELVYKNIHFPLSASYTFTQARFDSSFESDDPIYGSVQKGDTIPYIPSHQANGTLGVEFEPVRVGASVTYVSRMREEAGSGPLEETMATDEQFWVDLSAEYHVLKWLSLYGNLRNVNDLRAIVSRRPYGARPNAPRWLQVGLKADF